MPTSADNVWAGMPHDNVQQIAELLDIRRQASLAQVDRSFSELVAGVTSYASLVGCSTEHFQNTKCASITKTLNCNDGDAFQSGLIEMCEHPPSLLVIFSSRKLPRNLGWERMVPTVSLRHVLRCTVGVVHGGGNPDFLCHLIRSSYLGKLKTLSLGPYDGGRQKEVREKEGVDAGERELQAGDDLAKTSIIGAAGMKAITRAISSGSLASLSRLDLRSCNIGNSGLRHLAGLNQRRGGLLNELKELWLADNQITKVSLLVRRGALPKLNHLDLNNNKIDLADLSKAISRRLLPALTTLEVEVPEGAHTHIAAVCDAHGIEIR